MISNRRSRGVGRGQVDSGRKYFTPRVYEGRRRAFDAGTGRRVEPLLWTNVDPFILNPGSSTRAGIYFVTVTDACPTFPAAS